MATIERQLKNQTRITNHFINFKKTGRASMTQGACSARMEALQKLWKIFEENHNLLEDDEDIDPADNYFANDVFSQVEESFYTNLGLYKDHALQLQREEAALGAPAVHMGGDAEAPSLTLGKLPEIKLPTFSGEPSEWTKFRDYFTEMVVKRDLQPIAKMHYLRQALEGEAADLLEEVPHTGTHFDKAWKDLKDHYDNHRLQITKLVSKLLTIKGMANMSAKEVCRVRTATHNMLQALKALGSPIEHWDHITVFLTVSRLTPGIQRKWEEHVASSDDPQRSPTFNELENFLETERKALTQLESAKTFSTTSNTKSATDNKTKPIQSGQPKRTTAHVAKTEEQKPTNKKPDVCYLCNGEHYIARCEDFRSKSPAERRTLVVSRNLCFNCLSSRHKSQDCQNVKRCRSCNGKHHTLIHSTPPQGPTSNEQQKVSGSAPAAQQSTSGSASHTVSLHAPAACQQVKSNKTPATSVLLSTAAIQVHGTNGRFVLARALIDPGSQSSFITEQLCSVLKLKRTGVHMPVSGLGGQKNAICRSTVQFVVKPHFESNYELSVSSFVIPKITNYQPFVGESLPWTHIGDLTLADPEYHQTGNIDVLLGAAEHAAIVEEGVRRSGKTGTPIALKTSLGWTLSGATSSDHISSSVSLHVSVEDAELNKLVRRFWEIEEPPGSPKHGTEEENHCENFYRDTHTRKTDGRFVVRLPLKPSIPSDWGNSYEIAVKRMLALEKRFERNPEIREAYVKVFREYQSAGYMRQVAPIDLKKCYFLPHHAVLKESSTSTQVRPVFNASSKTNTGYSLNDFLHVGPNLLPDLVQLLSRWRLYQYVFTADCAKMYLQIEVAECDQHLQAIVWRENPADDLQIFFFRVVLFGYASSTFQATRSLHQLANDEGAELPLGAEILREETYMDDVVSGGRTVEEALLKQQQALSITRKGGFPLRKWMANNDILLQNLDPNLIAPAANLKVGTGFSVLGLVWDPKSDSFAYNVTLEPMEAKITRRNVLSKTSKLFDPLGWISPVIATLKIFNQSLWLSSKEWDAEIPADQAQYWINCYQSLAEVAEISIPRWIDAGSSSGLVEIHGFADASKIAYAGVVYLRIVGRADLILLGSKTKVAPIKTLSIPKLELNAAQVVTKLTKHFLDGLKLKNVTVHLWSDSRNVLCYLRKAPGNWPVFVANRCADILSTLPDAYWHHIESAQNPADIASRGKTAKELLNDELWWHGPKKLRNLKDNYPRAHDLDHEKPKIVENLAIFLEKELQFSPCFTSMIVAQPQSDESALWPVIKNKSNLAQLSRVLIYIVRFIRKIARKSRHEAKISALVRKCPIQSQPGVSSDEVKSAQLILSRIVQKVHFSEEVALLERGEELPKNHYLKSLSPILIDGVIRVGGRLENSLLSYDQKHPVLLPYNSHFTEMVVLHHHLITMHSQESATLFSIRHAFWILKGRLKVRTFIKNCTKCQRFLAKYSAQRMGDLPPERVRPSRAFQHTGVDLAGPYLLTASRHRGITSYKGYFVIFVCMATKASHLEVVSGYDTKSFLACLTRFASRRGLPETIHCDQGANLVGAEAELRKMFKDGSDFMNSVRNDLSRRGVVWQFIPPAAPHFGGLWEAAVRSTKYHLKRVVGDRIFSYEEFSTLLSQIEAVLNSRPLLPLTDDPAGLSFLTPAHFLIGESSFLFTESRNTGKLNPLERWRLISQLTQHFWDEWSADYLMQLQRRSKWKEEQPSYQVGDVVLIRHEHTAPTKWPLARVVKTYPGKDGLVRVVDVRTATTTLKRPIVKLVKLLSSSQEDE